MFRWNTVLCILTCQWGFFMMNSLIFHTSCISQGFGDTTERAAVIWGSQFTLPTKVCLVKAMFFQQSCMYVESWTIKKAEHQRIDAFELWCWRRLLRVAWTARRSNQFILKEISPEYSLEGLKLKVKLQYFDHLMWRTDSLKKTLMLGKIYSGRRRGQQRMRWLDEITTQWTWAWVNSRSWWWTGRTDVLQSLGSQKVRCYWETDLNWTEFEKIIITGRSEGQRG